MNSQPKKKFMVNVAIILLSQIAVKFLGMVYRMVITNIGGFGDTGNGYYNAGYQIYTLLLAISSIGIPNAIAKMTSEKNAVGDYRGAYNIYRSSLILFGIVGFCASAFLYLSADFIADVIIHMENAKYVLKALSPSILFVCLTSVIRGYFVGMDDMKATSTSQIWEQFFKCTLTVLVVYVMAKAAFSLPPEMLLPGMTAEEIAAETAEMKAAYMAAGANLATTLSTVLSFGYLILFYLKRRRSIMEKVNATTIRTEAKPFSKMAKSILMISIPISLGSIIAAINRIVDTATITRGIEIAFCDMIPASVFGEAILSPSAEQLSKAAVKLSGQLAKSDTLLNLPIAMNIAFATVLVPSIASAMARGEKKESSDKVCYSFLISLLIILPCALGYISMAHPIYKLIYPSASLGYDLLQISSVALIFIALNQTISGSLQGVGKIFAPATGLLMGCIAKFILNVLLIRIPQINIYGAPISSIVCQVISFSYGFSVLRRSVEVKISISRYIIKPLVASIVMSMVALGSYTGLLNVAGNRIACPVAIILAAGVYVFLVLAMRILTKEEFLQLPLGGKLFKLVQKVGFYSED